MWAACVASDDVRVLAKAETKKGANKTLNKLLPHLDTLEMASASVAAPQTSNRQQTPHTAVVAHRLATRHDVCVAALAPATTPAADVFALLDDLAALWADAVPSVPSKPSAAASKKFSKLMRKRIEAFNKAAAQAAPRETTTGAASSASDALLTRVHGEISDVREVMVRNIEQVLDRGERIDVLVDKAETMRDQSASFYKRSVTLKRRFCWRHAKTVCFCGVVALIVVGVIVLGACNWSFKCGHHPDPSPNATRARPFA